MAAEASGEALTRFHAADGDAQDLEPWMAGLTNGEYWLIWCIVSAPPRCQLVRDGCEATTHDDICS